MTTQTTTQPRAAGEAAHTLTPMLPLTAHHYEHCGEVTAILSAQGMNISTFGACVSSKEADAVRDVAATHALIVRACNSYAANQAEIARLRGALKRLLRAIEADAEQCPQMDVLTAFETNSQAVAQARAALAQTEKE